jgi:hypothetical protein
MRGKDSEGGGGANWPCKKKLPMPRILPIHPEPATSSLHTVLNVHKHEIFFFYFFCRNQDLMVPRACNTKIVFDLAEIFDF